MNVIAFFAASALSGGNPISQESWIRDVDYPREAQQLQQQGPAAYTLLVSPEGQVIECKITRSSGYRRLDSRACALLMSRAKFDPARDVDGSPAYMLYRDTISFALIGSKRQTLIYGSDIDVEVQRLPDNAPEAVVSIVVQNDRSGNFVACTSAKDKVASKQLIDLACKAAEPIEAAIVMDPKGQPVPVVQTLKVRFKVAAQ